MIGKRIHYLRKQQNLSKQDFAQRSGITIQELDKIETGNESNISNDNLISIANQFRFSKPTDFISFMQLNGKKRRFRAYTLGLPKSGTVSLAGLFSKYRSGHEFMQWDTHQTIIKYKNGTITKNEFIDFIKYRDAMASLEMDSAHFNRHYIDILADEYPDAKFIYLIRDCYGWISSFINYFVHPHHEALQSKELKNGMPFDIPHNDLQSKKRLVEEFDNYLHIPLSYWAQEQKKILQLLPSDRSLVIRTCDISKSIKKISSFIDIKPNTLNLERSHLNKSAYTINMLHQSEPEFLESQFQKYCGALMDRFYPGYTLQDYLNKKLLPSIQQEKLVV